MSTKYHIRDIRLTGSQDHSEEASGAISQTKNKVYYYGAASHIGPLLGFPVANLISAPGIISVQAANYIYAGSVGIELGLIGLIVLSEIFLVRRLWCNYVCPQGAFLGLFRIGKTMKVAYIEDEEHVCSQCFECEKSCQLGLDPMGGKIYPLCHNCGDCIAACQRIKAGGKPLSFKF